MAENSTPFAAAEYDKKITMTIPFYTEFHRQTIEVVKTMRYKTIHWLDTGCGTGLLAAKACAELEGCRFTLCDPSQKMLEAAEKNMKAVACAAEFRKASSQELAFRNEFEVVTAIQSHHYLRSSERETAAQNCYRALKKDGVFIYFENIAPSSSKGKELALERWKNYQIVHGKTREEAVLHAARYGKEYFPITAFEHKKLLEACGFCTVEMLWMSYMQAGFYAIK